MPRFRALRAARPKYLSRLLLASFLAVAAGSALAQAAAQPTSLLKSGAPAWKLADESRAWRIEGDQEARALVLRSPGGAASKGSMSQVADVVAGPLVVSGAARVQGQIEHLQWDVQVFDAAWKQLAWITSEENDAFKLRPSADWAPFRREIALPAGTAHAVFYFWAQGKGSVLLRDLALSPPNVEALNPQANTKISSTARVQVLGARPYKWASLLTGGVEYATGLAWSARHPQDLFLRADGGGIWRFDRKSQRWVALMDNLHWSWSNLATVDSLAIDPNDPSTIYVAGGSSRWSHPHDLLKTTDGGKTWARLHLKNARGEDVVSEGNGADKQAGERLLVDPNDSRTLYFGSRSDGLFASHDAGKSWANLPLPSNGARWTGISFVLADPSSSRAGAPSRTLTVGVHAGKASDEPGAPEVEGALFQSRDGGKSWAQLKGGPGGQASPMRARLSADGVLLVTFAGGSGGVWKWAGGQAQDITPPEGKGQPFCGLNFDPRDSRRIVAAGTYTFGPNIFVSGDGGSTWSRFHYERGKPQEGNIKLGDIPAWENTPDWNWGDNAADVAFDAAEPNTLWHLSFSGPSRLRLNGGSATASVVGAGREQMTTAEGLSPSAGAPYISGVWDVGGFRYDKGGFNTIPQTRLQLRKADGSTYTGYDTYRNGYQDIFDMDASPLLPDYIAVAGGWQWNNTGDASLSSDNGRTFRSFASKPFPDAKFGRIAISSDDSKNLVWAPLGSKTEAVYFTRDGGVTWAASRGAPRGMINTDGPWSFFKPLCADRVLKNTFYIYDRRSGHVLRSSDGGASWSHLSTLPTQTGANFDMHKLRAAPGKAGDLWLSLWDQGLFHSADGGSSWSKISGVDWAVNLAFGKPMPGRTAPSLFLIGQINGQAAKTEAEVEAQLYRSDDEGRRWTRLNGAERGMAQVGNITGDMQVPGRVYIGTSGRGTFYGQP